MQDQPCCQLCSREDTGGNGTHAAVVSALGAPPVTGLRTQTRPFRHGVSQPVFLWAASVINALFQDTYFMFNVSTQRY